MPRIPQDEIDRIKHEVRIEALVRVRGVELAAHGSNLVGRCPFHDDRGPSLVVTPSKNLWHCMGACQRGGSVIDWVIVAEKLAFHDAMTWLIERYPASGVARTIDASGEECEPMPDISGPCPIAPEMSDREMLDAITRFYHERLLALEAPREYLERRAIGGEDVARTFRVGFADRSLGLTLPPPGTKSGVDLRARLAMLGIYRESTGREHFNGCVTFPVFDANGEVVEIYGRKIRDDMRHKHGSHLYLPGPHRGVWNREGVERCEGTVILCEALIDAATFWAAGFRNVTAAYGINGFTAELRDLLKQSRIERVLIAYDRDDAGDRAAEALGRELASDGIGAFRVVFPRGMDANDYARKLKPPQAALAITLRSAEWLGGPKQRAVVGPIPAAIVESESPAPEQQLLSLAAPLPDHDEQPDEAAPPLAAETVALTPEPPPPVTPDRALSVSDYSTIDLTFGDRRYRVRGLEKNLSYSAMKVVLRVARDEQFFLDTVDLVSARHRVAFVKQAAVDLGVKDEVIKRDVAALYRELEQIQEAMIRKSLEPKESRPPMSEDDLRDAMALAKDPNLLDRILGDYERCGVVGERTNKLVAFLAAVSRLLDDPIAIIIQSSSAAGKTKVMDAVLDFIPEEDRVRYSAMTGQSLFYFEGKSLSHKILAISEEEGAERAAYALKLLQSEGQLTIASTGKNPHTGRLETHEYRVEGPVMIFLTTTAVEIDEELRNRCIVLTVDEDRAQTRAIHALQREGETLEGMVAREERKNVFRLQRNMQRLLRPIRVVNPFAKRLRFPDAATRMRRDHTKYLALIRAIALVHQHQRERKTFAHKSGPLEYIEVTAADIALANELAHEVLGRSLDELAPQTRRLLVLLDQLVTQECAHLAMARCDFRLTNRRVREFTGWTDFQVRTHVNKLIAMEYLLVHRGVRGQSFVYELLYDGKGRDGKPFLIGLIESEHLHHDAKDAPNPEHRIGHPEHRIGESEHGASPQRVSNEHGSSLAENDGIANADSPFMKVRVRTSKNTHAGGNGKDSPSYPSPVVASAPSRGEA